LKVNELVQKLELEVLCEGESFFSDIDGCFAGDLLSLAMSNVRAGNVWITVQTNMNILGIASLTEASCTIVANGMNIPDAVIEKAKEENICLLRSEKGMYELCLSVGELI